MRAAALAAALALAGCRLSPANGYAVDVTVIAAPSLPATTAAAIGALAESVGGDEVYDHRYTLASQLRDGAARFVYRPAVGDGRLTFTIDGLDGGGVPVARGMGEVTLAHGATMSLTVALVPYSAPPDVDMCEASVDAGADLATSAPDLALDDQHLCEASCATLIGCGVPQQQAQCLATCLDPRAAVFRTCARSAGGDCNQLALCSHKQWAAVLCTAGPSAGIPIGGVSCHDTATCEAKCNLAANPALVISCSCDCRSELDPAQALNHLINNTCVSNHCANMCSLSSTSFNGASCNSCGLMYCGNDSCMLH